MVASAIAGGFLGTLVLSTVIKAASEMALTRMDLALLLGTTVTDNRRKARAIGYVFHLGLGILFALAYGVFFQIIGRDTWWIGALLGASVLAWFAWRAARSVPSDPGPRAGTGSDALVED